MGARGSSVDTDKSIADAAASLAWGKVALGPHRDAALSIELVLRACTQLNDRVTAIEKRLDDRPRDDD